MQPVRHTTELADGATSVERVSHPDLAAEQAYVDGDPLPAAMARMVRDAHDRRAGEIAFEVADTYQGCGVGTQLVELLLAHGRAAGIERVDALVQPSNRAALDLLRRVLGASIVRVEDGEMMITAAV